MRPHLDQELSAIRSSILALGARVSDATGHAAHALLNRDLDEAREVKREDQTSDALRYAIENACVVTMATQQPMARDLRALLGAAFVAVELERCGDYAKGVAKAARRIVRVAPALDVAFNLAQMAEAARSMLDRSVAAFAASDAEAARAVMAGDDSLDALYDALLKAVVARMSADPAFADYGIWLLHAGHCLERIGDRATNIAERVVFIATGALTGDTNTHDIERTRSLR
jgi:phosphate transport system protein